MDATVLLSLDSLFALITLTALEIVPGDRQHHFHRCADWPRAS